MVRNIIAITLLLAASAGVSGAQTPGMQERPSIMIREQAFAKREMEAQVVKRAALDRSLRSERRPENNTRISQRRASTQHAVAAASLPVRPQIHPLAWRAVSIAERKTVPTSQGGARPVPRPNSGRTM